MWAVRELATRVVSTAAALEAAVGLATAEGAPRMCVSILANSTSVFSWRAAAALKAATVTPTKTSNTDVVDGVEAPPVVMVTRAGIQVPIRAAAAPVARGIWAVSVVPAG
jgi:hypothetical protein